MNNGVIDNASQTTATYVQGVCPSATYVSATKVLTIPSTCYDSAAKVMKTEWPTANVPSSTNNSQRVSGTGSDTSSWVGRVDYSLSSKQRLFARFTRSILTDEAQEWMPGGVDPSGKTWHIGGGTTHNRALSGVIGDTYTFNPSTILDVRLSVMRVYNDQVPPTIGMDLSIFGSNWASLAKSMTVVNLPSVNVTDNACAAGTYCAPTGFGNAGQISLQWNDNEAAVFSLTKIVGPHSLKMGGEIRFMDRYMLNESGQASAGGSLNFSNQYFSGNGWANFLLGLPNSATLTTTREVGSVNLYQGYYINDTWQTSHKLTINAGLRWELSGNVKEKHDSAMELAPATTASITNPTTGATGNVYGTAVLVNSTAYPDRGTEPARHDIFAPNAGFAYRLTDSDVIRGGYGLNVAAIDIQGGMFPDQASMNSFSNTWDFGASGITNPLSNPFPSGLTQAPGRAGFTQSLFLQQNLTAPVASMKYPYTQQWNLAVSHQFKGDLMLEVGYAGSSAKNLPMTFVYNELNHMYWNDQSLYTNQSNTAASTVAGTMLTQSQLDTCNTAWKKVTPTKTTYTSYGQCARPYQAYLNFNDVIGPTGFTSYHSMPIRIQKRFKSGGQVSASYAWAKALGNTGGGNIQDWYNLKAEKALTGFSLPRRLVVSYVVNIPFGKGQKFLSSVSNPVASRLISGWTVNGITTFQSGFPVTITASMPQGQRSIPNTYGAGLRPNYAPGCPKMAGGSWKSHVLAGTSVLNNSCWSAPPVAYTISGTGYATTTGNQPRVDPEVRQPGYNNWDLSIVKKTAVTERFNLEFRAEFFNVWNHIRFGGPGSTVNGGQAPTFGIISGSSQGENQPRLGQLSLRLNF